jgi:hypothetical protein
MSRVCKKHNNNKISNPYLKFKLDEIDNLKKILKKCYVFLKSTNLIDNDELDRCVEYMVNSKIFMDENKDLF